MRGDRSAMRVTRGMHLEAKIFIDAAGEVYAWRAGEVIWGNGHSYVLRWFDGGPDSERIRRTDVRPLPDPSVKLPADLAAGDSVEVLHSNLWKRAKVVGAAGHGQFEVKIAGSTEVLAADLSVLRPRMAYEGGEKGWVVIQKGEKIPVESAQPWRPVAGKNIKSKANINGGGKFAAHATNLNLGKTKRSNYAVDADIVRDVKRFQGNVFLAKREPAARYHDNNIEVMDEHPSHYLKKREQETSNHDKPNNEEIDVVGGGTDSDSDDDSNSSKSDPSSSSDGDSSSSGGSNSNSNGGARAVPPTAEHCQENQEVQSPPSCKEEEQDSEERTESRGSAGMRHRPAADEEEEQNEQVEEHDHRVHGLELEAYVSVMKAFYFTGPLTWAKEELLSDLRLQLHVSSDEHLQAIWRLKGKK
ncbi:hypothetical protein CFC21_005188 [Triticum aestivum]|uniref:ENT domain-containing protein n=2 Tax=Triticum aestivum TaxID=4565 RepID=A0A9R1INV3_WHEAT|nr:uncharacterized protein LOC123105763 [Triticum aestivum]KAF6987555.1 hypothetical protein CFC21_005188 [Triticum aestivum]